MKILVTGGCGFIGSNFINYWINKNPHDEIVNLDLLTYAGQGNNLKHMGLEDHENYKFVEGNICNSGLVDYLFKEHNPDCVVNFAAESHNSLAILNPGIFYQTNTMGAFTLLEAVRKNKVQRFHHISTCEIYGDLELDSEEKFDEESPVNPNTPYNASKAAADLIVRADYRTFGTPTTISNCCNNYGPFQFPEKLIPLFSTNLIEGQKVPVYKNSGNKREWLHVLDHCRAIEVILRRGKIGETYNVGSGIERSVEEITDILLKRLHKGQEMKQYVTDRPSHDKRYLLDSTKIEKELGWKPGILFEDGINLTIEWYKQNKDWWEPLKEMVIDEGKWSLKDER